MPRKDPTTPIELGSPRARRTTGNWVRQHWVALIGMTGGLLTAIVGAAWLLSSDLSVIETRVSQEALRATRTLEQQQGLRVRVRTLEATQAATQVLLGQLDETLGELTVELKELRQMHERTRRRRRRR